ncbi:MAG: tRNA (adenosine(37)-N6)-threonylcarbamoyltransferase complex dimerization subunit type 1 TsaB [Myxococcales bacterium]|nr:MAG: tRNA (adenosine(37)-N6)-threonylcarbamoyltransferase complex dimerization subunit type 1 TsaB [Myxococcales bacterium]
MKVLALDTSTYLGTIALLEDGQLRAELSTHVRAKHGETVLPHVKHVLELAGFALTDMDLLAVGLGPGSFTGTRVGVATMKGLAFATGIPLVGVCSLRGTASMSASDSVLSVVMMDAYKNEVYMAVYQRKPDGMLQECLAPLHCSAEAACDLLLNEFKEARFVISGDGLQKYDALIRESLKNQANYQFQVFASPRASFLADEAVRQFEQHGPSDIDSLEPLYIRGSDAKLPKIPQKTSSTVLGEES